MEKLKMEKLNSVTKKVNFILLVQKLKF